MPRIAHAAVAALLVSALACSDRERESTADRVDDAGERVESAAEEAGREIEDAGRDLGEYTYAERDDFRAAVRQRVQEVDEEIAALGRETRGAPGTLSDETLAPIRQARRDVDQGLERVGDAAEDDWNDVRDGVERSIENLRKAIADVRSTSGPMGGRAAGQT